MRAPAPAPFISLVGHSPAAVAIPVAAWLGRHPGTLTRGILLETEPIRRTGMGSRLSKWAQDSHGVALECVAIPPDPAELQEVVRTLLSEREWLGPVICNAAAGPNAHDQALAAAVNPETTFLYSSFREGLCAARYSPTETMQFSSLPDLGLDTLLSLWGQAKRWTSTTEVPASTRRVLGWQDLIPLIRAKVVWDLDLVIEGKTHRLDAAYESQGELHGLFLRAQFEWPKLKATTIERRIGAVRRRLAETGLRFRPVVVTDWPLLAERIGAGGLSTVMPLGTRSGREALGRWLSPAPRPQAAPGAPSDHQLGSVTTIPGTGSGTGRLAVCLGNDPSSTLVALATHAPGEAWICYTPEVEAVRARLAAQITGGASGLAVHQVHWVRTDVYGRGIRAALSGGWSQSPGAVNFSPGTKGQTLALAGVPRTSGWSIRAHTREAVCLDDRKSLRLRGPTLEDQARVAGGRLASSVLPVREGHLDEFEGFYTTLTEVISAHTRWGLGVRHELKDVSPAPPDWQRKHDSVLFETVIGHCLRRAGADEVAVGLEWRTHEGQPRDEIDVVARFEARFIAIECKAQFIKNPDEIYDLATMHSARTRECLGRFALPVLVVAGGMPYHASRSGSVRWDLQTLVTPKRLRKALATAFRLRSTSLS